MTITNGTYVIITDKGECCSTLHKSPHMVIWNNEQYKNIANKDVWQKYNFYLELPIPDADKVKQQIINFALWEENIMTRHLKRMPLS